MISLSWSDAIRFLIIGFMYFFYYYFLNPDKIANISNMNELLILGISLTLGAQTYFLYRSLIFNMILKLKDNLGNQNNNYRLYIKKIVKINNNKYMKNIDKFNSEDFELIYSCLRNEIGRDKDKRLDITASGIHFMYMSAILAISFSIYGIFICFIKSLFLLCVAVAFLTGAFRTDIKLETEELFLLKKINKNNIENVADIIYKK